MPVDAASPPPKPDWAEATEGRVLDAAVALAVATPWGGVLVVRAAAAAGLSAADAELLLPGGARDLAALLWRRHDGAALARLAVLDPHAMKVRERIRCGVEARVEAAMADEAAVRRASVFLARPDNVGLGLRLAWASADALWRWAGDVSTDENHYSKRAILAAILVSTSAVRLSAGRERAQSHLAARIEGVMRFERFKANLPRPSDGLASVAGALGRLRYRS